MSDTPKIYGLMAEFYDADALLAAANAAHDAGYHDLDAFSPFPIDGLAEAIGARRSKVPLIMLLGGVFGACLAYFMMWYTAAVNYRWNIGGRPYHAWPSFVPITFEWGVLFGCIAGLIGMLALNGLPMPYHPVFNTPGFRRASRDRFFLCIMATDAKFDTQATRRFLEGTHPKRVREVEP